MAGLNLVPNPAVLAIQAGIFLSTMVVIKKFFLEPYYKVRAKRDGATIGSQAEATELLASNAANLEKLNARLSASMVQMKEASVGIRSNATKKREEILSVADQQARETIGTVRKDIDRELGQEKAKLPEVVANLTNQLYSQVLN